ncbi:MAG: type I pullulanase [Lachnospiraceae bacterium]|nr:type I pullulanase [Lachnospiraceae bacterium]
MRKGKRKQFFRKGVSAVMLLLLVLSSTLSMTGFHLTVKAAGTTLIVHYGGREDSNYENWNLWIWEEGADGQTVEFRSEDDYGKIAVYQTANTPEKIGFIVRKGDWEAKDVESDRFVEMKDETTEIWITSGVEDFVYEAPEGFASYDFAGQEQERLNIYEQEDALKLNVHYYREDGSYQGSEALGFRNENAPGSYPYVETDDFGAVYHIGLAGEDREGEYGLDLYVDGKADALFSRKIDLSKAVDGVLNVYTVEGKNQVWYSKEEVDFTPAILNASFAEGSTKQIDVVLSKAIDTKDESAYSRFKVVDETGSEYGIMKLWNDTPGVVTAMKVILEEELSLSHTYSIQCEGYSECTVAIDKAFSAAAFEEEFTYEGDDLGAVYSKERTVFRVWAPTAQKVAINFYEAGDGDCLIESVDMTSAQKGTWTYEKEGDANGIYYTYNVTVNGSTKEAVDPYAKAVGVNGNRGMVIDLDSTDPEGFDKDTKPELVNMTDAVLYELHVRDLSSDVSSGIENTGKFLGLTETGTTNSQGLATGLDHMKDLGITHVHILPSFDYATVDETNLESNQFNWGYDPKNYNVPEGSYSTDPYNGAVRVQEYKQMVQTLHENGIRVVMDVVYNHTFNTEDSSFQKIVPDYYYRKNGELFSNASGCGNETASERSMMRKFMVDSVVYWATEYHVDGFRFDLMGIHDMETMQEIRAALNDIDPSIIVYGEGWTSGDSTLPETQRALKKNISLMEGIAAFSDDIRDGIKGNVFDALDRGFVNGGESMENAIKYSVAGATENQQVDYDSYEKSNGPWAGAPTQTINYVSCHDNLTIWDKLAISNEEDSTEDRVKMNKLASAIVFTSQGIPFLQAGEELLRSKELEDGTFSENSYNLPDSVNAIKWDTKGENLDVYEYYKGLIALRKAHPAFRMTTTQEVQENLTFVETEDENLVAYTIDNSPNQESAESIFVAYNGSKEEKVLPLSQGEWDMYVNGEKAGNEVISTAKEQIAVSGLSAVVLIKGSTQGNSANTANTPNTGMYVMIGVVAAAVFCGVIAFVVITNNKKFKTGKK